MNYARRQDDNHGTIVKALALHGFKIFDASHVGRGHPDLTVGFESWLGPVQFGIEIKDGSKPPSARRLTPAQVEFRKSYPWVRIVEVLCVEDVQRLAASLRNPLAAVAT